ncbi:MAG TPA: hypothetical protein DF294_05515 [Psychrobacter sp.]|nr:hypothetical protein [Psychrobacter sp.]
MQNIIKQLLNKAQPKTKISDNECRLSVQELLILIRACPHFKNGDKNEINCRQTRKVAQIISRY